jgi:hypothetical protein
MPNKPTSRRRRVVGWEQQQRPDQASKNQRGLVDNYPPEPEPEPPAAGLATSVSWSRICRGTPEREVSVTEIRVRWADSGMISGRGDYGREAQQ